MNAMTPTLPHVLIATADEQARERILAMLDAWRYPHLLVEDGPAALRLLTQAQPPSIAVIDNQLAGLAGVQVIQAARNRYDQSRTWLMLLGAQASTGDVRMASEAGADDFLLKPVEEFDFRVRLRVAERVQTLMLELQQQNEAVRFHASHDAMTGLLNREAMLKQLFQETDRAQRMKTPLSYLLVDIDSFSSINLSYGYDLGDCLLQELAGRLKRHLRSYDLAGRYGEDEFLIALPGCAPDSLIPMAERMRKSVLDKPFDIGKERLDITASIGAAHSMGRSPLVVLRELEAALARAKMEGRNCIREAGAAPELNMTLLEPNPMLLRLPEIDPKKLN
uniref:diguanylate cyclase n=1 Tax=Acidobacterium capsulatum TaxID=33075 RepID=A0A7V4XVA2_9BACT